MLQQMFRAARLDRNLYTELIFDSYATGNAVLVVVIVYAAVYLGGVVAGELRLNIVVLLSLMLTGLVRWLVAAGALWLMGTKLYPGEARVPTIVRLSGFAHVALLLLVLQPFADGIVSDLIFVAALAWFGLSLAVISEVSMNLARRQAAVSALLAVAVWYVFSFVFRI